MNTTTVFGPPPPGVNLEDDRTSQDNAVVATICVLSILTVLLRYFVRLHIQGARLEVDDCLVGASVVPLAVLLAISLLGGYHGFGKHVWCTTLEDMVIMKKNLFACCLLYLVELLLIKVSILMFYRRIFGMNWMIWGCLIISGCWCIGSMIAALCACQPVSYFWNELTDPTSGRYRYNFYYYYIGNGTANMVTDVLILLVPMPIIWRLQIRTGQKIGVCSILLLGGFVCVASIVRIYYITFLDGNMDLTWALSDVNVWSTVEPCIGIICACLPALQPLIRLIAKRMPSKQHFGAGRRTATIQRPRPSSRHTKSRKSSTHEVWHGQQQDCDSSMKTFFRSGEDQMRLNTITTRVEMEQDSKQRDSLDERLDPMAIRVKRVVHWSVD